MAQLKPLRLAGAVVVLAGAPLLTGSVLAQVQTPPSPNAQMETQAPPKPQVQTPSSPNARVQTLPSPNASTAPSRTDKSATAPANTLVGLAVFSSDGSKMGTVHSVAAAPDGAVKAIHFKTGGFLGFGGKLVAVPEGRFTKAGENIQLGITADEVSKLAEIKEQS